MAQRQEGADLAEMTSGDFASGCGRSWIPQAPGNDAGWRGVDGTARLAIGVVMRFSPKRGLDRRRGGVTLSVCAGNALRLIVSGSGRRQPERLWETDCMTTGGQTPVEDGAIRAPPGQKPKLLRQVRMALRSRHYARRTEKTCVMWVRRFIYTHVLNRGGKGVKTPVDNL